MLKIHDFSLIKFPNIFRCDHFSKEHSSFLKSAFSFFPIEFFGTIIFIVSCPAFQFQTNLWVFFLQLSCCLLRKSTFGHKPWHLLFDFLCFFLGVHRTTSFIDICSFQKFLLSIPDLHLLQAVLSFLWRLHTPRVWRMGLLRNFTELRLNCS